MPESVRLATKDSILDVQDLKVEDLLVPEWATEKYPDGQWVRIRQIDGLEREHLQEQFIEWQTATPDSVIPSNGSQRKTSPARFQLSLCARCMVDAHGNRIFSDDEVELLGKKSPTALDRIFEVAARLSGFSKSAVEEAEGNSEGVPSGASS